MLYGYGLMFLQRERDLSRWVTGGVSVLCVLISMWVGVQSSEAALGPSDVLLVVNQDSPTSVQIADLYRQYHPGIADNQILYLSGMPDSSGADSTAANEIITRADFNTKIADPVRQHLITNSLVNQTKVIITTAGLPYRIEDTAMPNVVYPGGSSAYPADLVGTVNAASVESELSVLFQIDPASAKPLSLANRVVNPYQGYRGSPIDAFPRNILGNRQNMNWQAPLATGTPPVMEGTRNWYGVKDRHFSAGDIYLTSRLDGPKRQGESALLAVHAMLDLAHLASSSEHGINPTKTTVVFDDAPGVTNLNRNRIFNLDSGVDFNVYQAGTKQPPDTKFPEVRDDYYSGFEQLTGQMSAEGIRNLASMIDGHALAVIHDLLANHRTSQSDLEGGRTVVGLTSFGRNGDEGASSTYLLNGGPNGGALFNLSYGAVFNSIESFNAATMFSDVTTGPVAQGKIIDFLAIGGSGAIGHVFEPLADAIVNNEFLFYNLLADANGDGFADETFVEAAFSALPYLSWSEVVVGDPLMRIAYGPGRIDYGNRLPGDTDLDGDVDLADLGSLASHYGMSAGATWGMGDFNGDGAVNLYDLGAMAGNYGAGLPQVDGAVVAPEPGTIVLMGFAGALGFCRRSGRVRREQRSIF